MDTASNSPVTLVNVVTVKSGATQGAVIDSLRHNTETVIMTLTGWISTSLVACSGGERVVIYSRWNSAADVEAMRADPRMLAYFPHIGEIASFDSMIGAEVMAHHG